MLPIALPRVKTIDGSEKLRHLVAHAIGQVQAAAALSPTGKTLLATDLVQFLDSAKAKVSALAPA